MPNMKLATLEQVETLKADLASVDSRLSESVADIERTVVFGENATLPLTSIEHGSLTVTGIPEASVKAYRCRSNNKTRCKKNAVITAKDGYQFYFFMFANGAETATRTSGAWVTSYNFDASVYTDFKMTIRKFVNGAEVTTVTADIHEYANAITLEVESDSYDKGFYAYFANHDKPSFYNLGANIVVKFPAVNFRIYDNSGKAILNTNTYFHEEYSIAPFNKLVYDASAKNLSVKQISEGNNECITLLGFAGGTTFGIFKPFYDTQSENYSDSDSVIYNNLVTGSEFKCVFFSDIHGSADNFKRIVDYANARSTQINAIINGGDTINGLATESLEWYNSLVDTSNVDVLNCVGNHDAWSQYWVTDPAVDVYNRITKKVADTVTGLVQPSNASSAGKTYYYKDYGRVRIIVLSAMTYSNQMMLWDTAQATWFENVLADANANGKTVVCVSHAPFDLSVAQLVDSPWTSFLAKDGQWGDPIILNNQAVQKVNAYIDNGGKFACWLTGHEHIDHLVTANGYDGQIMINIASANYGKHTDGYASQKQFAKQFDCFNVIGVDADYGVLKVQRVGYNTDIGLKVRNYLCYDYINKKVVSQG